MIRTAVAVAVARNNTIPADTARALERLLLDRCDCAAGAARSPAVKAARKMAAGIFGTSPAEARRRLD